VKRIGFLVSLVMVVAAGCAPVISIKALEPVDKNLGFETLLENPDRYAGKSVLLGGDIIETEPLPSKTCIVVLQRPLGSRAKPSKEKGSKGRFVVMAEGFLDPAIYRAGRQVTLVGKVVGREVRPLGQIQYGYPLVANIELYLWPVEEAAKEWRFYIGASSVKVF
jgi:outer membrane lipoprotein